MKYATAVSTTVSICPDAGRRWAAATAPVPFTLVICLPFRAFRICGLSAGLRTAAIASEAAGHAGDHGPVDGGFVASGEAFVVAGAATVAGDPGQGSFHHPPAGQDFEGVQAVGALDDLDG